MMFCCRKKCCFKVVCFCGNVSLFLTSVVLLYFVQGCRKEDEKNSRVDKSIKFDDNDCKSEGLRVFIVNAGTARTSASLSYYLPCEKKLFNNVYEKATGDILGRLAKNMVIDNGRGYITVSGSNRIVVIDVNTFEKIAQIDDKFSKPDQISFINSEKLYVNHFMDPNISIIHPKYYTILGKVDLKGIDSGKNHYLSSNMLMYKNLAFVALSFPGSPGKVLVVDTQKDAVIDTIQVADYPSALELDKNNKLWVLHSGDYYVAFAKQPRLSRIDVKTWKLDFEFLIPIEKNVQLFGMTMNEERDTLYWVGEGNVWKMPVAYDKAPSKPFITVPSTPSDLDTIIIDPVSKDIYLVDVIYENNDQQKGRLYRYSEDGKLIDNQETDVRPICLVFDTLSPYDGRK